MTITLDTLRERRPEVLDIARRRGVRAVWVFGSVARGDAGTASDVDFLVEFEPGRSLFDQVHLIEALRVLRWVPQLTSSPGTVCSIETSTFSMRPFLCDQGRRAPHRRHPRRG